MFPLRRLTTLWLPVPVFAAAGWLLVTGDLAVQDGVPDLDPLFGLATLFVIGVTGAGGVVALVLAVVGSCSARTRPALSLANAIWTAATLVPFAAYLAVVTYLEPAYERSTGLGQQVPYQAAAAVLAVVPLALALLERRGARTARPPAVTQASRA